MTHPTQRRKASMASKIRRMLAQGMTPKEIATKLRIDAQRVYYVRYQDNKKLGLGSLPATPEPTTTTTTITITAPVVTPTPIITPEPAAPPPAVFVADTSCSRYLPDPPTRPEQPTLWQRVKGWVSAWR
jgi:hypothetical protein